MEIYQEQMNTFARMYPKAVDRRLDMLLRQVVTAGEEGPGAETARMQYEALLFAV